jgi:FkbM family methyltransferase
MRARDVRNFVQILVNWRGRRRFLSREYFFIAAKRFTPQLTVQCDGMRFTVSTKDDMVGRYTWNSERPWAFDDLGRVVELLRSLGRDPAGRHLIEIGANIGTTTVAALMKFGFAGAVCVEPAPENFGLLRTNLIDNGLGDRVRLIHGAMSDRDGEGVLSLSKDNSGDHRIADDNCTGGIAIRMQRFDTVVSADELSRAGLVWIDVQGHEPHVLAGGDTLLASRAPVAIEYWPNQLRANGKLDAFHATIARHYDVVYELLENETISYPADQVASAADRYTAQSAVGNLLLWKR